MATGSTKKKQAITAKSGVPIPILVVAICVIFALIGRLYFVNFVPHPAPVVHQMSPEMSQLNDWIHKKAIECKGDFNKLSPEDQQYLQQNTRGMGQMIMQNVYKGTGN